MNRIKRKQTVKIGGRIRVTEANLRWSGMLVPKGTEGTVYLHDYGPFKGRAVQWDGFPQFQGSGAPFGIGGDASKTFVPFWAELVEGV